MATKEKEKVKRSSIIKAAKELNALLFEEGDEQMMNVKADEKDLLGQLKEASSIIDENDEISDGTRDTLIELGFLEGEAEEEEEEEKEKESEEEEEESEEDLLGLIKRSPKLQQLKDLVKSHDELKPLRKKLDKYSGLQGTKKLREDMLSAVDELPPTKKEKEMSTKRKETAKKVPVRKVLAKEKKVTTKTKTKTGHKMEMDKYGFRPGCIKSQVMVLIEKGKHTKDALVKEFGGQVINAIKQAPQHTKIQIVTNTKGQLGIKN